MKKNRIGQNLQTLRKLNNISQKELAKKLSTSRQAISSYERGIRTPDIEILWNMADIFSVSIDTLVGRE